MTAADEEQGPIASATATLVGWLAQVTGGDVASRPPDDEATGGLAVWPLELVAQREMRTARTREPLRFHVRHLVAGDTGLLDKALVAATVAGEPEVRLTPLPEQGWLALRCRPQVALLVDMPALIERPTPDIPIVTEELRVDLVPRAAVPTIKEA